MEVFLLQTVAGKAVLHRQADLLSLWSFERKSCTETQRLRVPDLLAVKVLPSPQRSWVFLLDTAYNWSLLDSKLTVLQQGKLTGISHREDVVSCAWFEDEKWHLVLSLQPLRLHHLCFCFLNGALQTRTSELLLSNDAHWPCRTSGVRAISVVKGSLSRDYRVSTS